MNRLIAIGNKGQYWRWDQTILYCYVQNAHESFLWQVLEQKVPIVGVSQHKIDIYLHTVEERHCYCEARSGNFLSTSCVAL